MRNLTNPTIVELGTITKASGQEYHVQRLRYGTHFHIHVFRKGALHKRGTIFPSEQAFEEWKNNASQQLLALQ